MKAKVQYNDYVGTCAADISDHVKLDDILCEWGVDTNRFYPVGVSFFTGDTGQCHLSILCTDNQRNDGKIVKVCNYKKPERTIQDVMAFFKRFEAIVSTENLQNRELVDIPAVEIE